MKKLSAIIVTMLLLIGIMIYGVCAEGFQFRETARAFQNGYMLVTWNQSDLSDGQDIQFEEVKIGSHECPIVAVNNDTITVDVADLPSGSYATVRYSYLLDGVERTATVFDGVTVAGDVAVTLTMTFNEDGSLTVKATDPSGSPIAGYTVSLSIGSMSNIRKTTGSDGTYTSRLLTSYGQSAYCQGVRTEAEGGVVYLGTEQITAVRTEPTTTADPTATTGTETTGTETTTTESTAETTVTDSEPTTTVTQTVITFPAIRGVGTTAVQGNRIAVNVSLDTNVLQQFGLTMEDFDKTGRLLLEKNDYSDLVQRSNSRLLMLNLLTAQNAPNAAQLETAVAGSSFSKYAPEDQKALSFDLSFLILDKVSGTVIQNASVPLNTAYIIQLPVPANMRDCAQFAVSTSNGGTVGELIPVEVKNGYFQLQLGSLDSYTLFGFGSGGSVANGFGGNTVLLIVLGVVALVLLLAGGALLYWFVIRKPVPKRKRRVAAVPTTLGEDDIYSGRSDFSEITRRPPSDMR